MRFCTGKYKGHENHPRSKQNPPSPHRLNPQAIPLKWILFSSSHFSSSLPITPLLYLLRGCRIILHHNLTDLVCSKEAMMAITHDDLSLKKLKEAGISSRLALFLVIFSVLCGLTAFILCLTAEGSRSEVTYLLVTTPSSKDYKCYYSGSGRTPLACAVAAFLILAIAMFTEHAYMLIAVTNPQPPALAAWTTPQDPRATSTNRDLTWQSCFLFLTTWVFFALAEVLLMIGIGVESGHLSNWTSPKPNCHAVRPGVFAVAGVFGLVTVFLGVGLYLTALRSQRLQLQEHGRIPTGPGPYPHVPPTAPVIEERQSQRQPPQHVDKTSTSA